MNGAGRVSTKPGSTGKFITLEGGEGAGKSTQIARLVAYLRDAGIDVVATREPGGAPGAEAIRTLLVEGEPGRWTPLTEALLHSAARADHLARTVRPALAAGKWVVCDRFTDSTLAYQGFGHGLDAAKLRALNDLVTDGLTPDLTLILDLPVVEGLARAGGRPGAEDRYERMGHDFHDRLRQGFLAIARTDPARCAVIDSTADVDIVAGNIARVVSERLGTPAP
jgi:dTMP kinase